MSLGLVEVGLRRALAQDGCPICRIQAEAEARYLRFLLWESVNDASTRLRIIDSLGFCPVHTRQAAQMEQEMFNDAMGNAIIYEHLVQVVIERIDSYLGDSPKARPSRWRGLADRVRPLGSKLTPANDLTPNQPCRVCQAGESSADLSLKALLRGLPNDGELRSLFETSDGLCLHHVRGAWELASHDELKGLTYLLRRTAERLKPLADSLTGYVDKHAWERRHDPIEPAEESSVARAVAFFAGSLKGESAPPSGRDRADDHDPKGHPKGQPAA